ncbi:MAG: Uma2 family endonuclease [Cyanobacteria bacterium J06648_10]
MMPLTLEMKSADLRLNDAEFYRLCQANRDLKLELSAEGNLIIMPPTGWETGQRNSSLNRIVGNWAEEDGTGIIFDSSTGFKLPNGATRSPDVSWVLKTRIEAIEPDPDKFLPLCPDLAIELRSTNDNLSDAQDKMQEYFDNGLKLGWLIDPKRREVEIYRDKRSVEIVDFSTALSGEAVLPNFTFDLTKVFS